MRGFPFGLPIKPLRQVDCGPKLVFVLGVYASAVHGRWLRADGSTAINAVAVASEPEIFWRGEDADKIIATVPVPDGAGHLVAVGEQLNGPSGRTLDRYFLAPLGFGNRNDVWLCDLLPESRCNPKQAAALEREYGEAVARWNLPAYNFPKVPSTLADADRVREIEREIADASPEVLITLGDQPLRWFTKIHGSRSRLAAYGETVDTYGRFHNIAIAGRPIRLLPLVHPRQAGRLGSYSRKWNDLHNHWAQYVAPRIIAESA